MKLSWGTLQWPNGDGAMLWEFRPFNSTVDIGPLKSGSDDWKNENINLTRTQQRTHNNILGTSTTTIHSLPFFFQIRLARTSFAEWYVDPELQSRYQPSRVGSRTMPWLERLGRRHFQSDSKLDAIRHYHAFQRDTGYAQQVLRRSHLEFSVQIFQHRPEVGPALCQTGKKTLSTHRCRGRFVAIIFFRNVELLL